jgi:IS30 family transposase
VGRYGLSHLVTLVERHSRYLPVLPLSDATTTTVVAAVTAAFQQLPPTMRRSLTWDRGVEMTLHADFTAATGLPVYFCDAYCPWQRGSNENSNGLLRQYFPKKTDLSQHDVGHVQAVVNELSTRPRQTLGWQTPDEVFWAATVAMIA